MKRGMMNNLKKTKVMKIKRRRKREERSQHQFSILKDIKKQSRMKISSFMKTGQFLKDILIPLSREILSPIYQ
jgi:hypothetical protein